MTTPENRKRSSSEAARERIEVGLVHSRARDLGWMVTWGALGVWLLLREGTDVFTLVGAFVALLALSHGRDLVRSLLATPSQIAVRDADAVLPKQLYDAKATAVPMREIRHAYVIRRALPWGTPGPLLVVETERGAFEYPSHWFANTTDPLSVATVLSRRLGKI